MDRREELIEEIKELHNQYEKISKEPWWMETFRNDNRFIRTGASEYFLGGYGDLVKDPEAYAKWKDSKFMKYRFAIGAKYPFYVPVRYQSKFTQGFVPPQGYMYLPHLNIIFYGVCDAAFIRGNVCKMHIYDPYDELTIECPKEVLRYEIRDLIGKMVSVASIIHMTGYEEEPYIEVFWVDDFERILEEECSSYIRPWYF